ncbi:MAG: hypothetical protein K2K97_06820, partial [Muribaculaceae bacterium]|nr:hypothetical protein [Muribaculaceae bacterium]
MSKEEVGTMSFSSDFSYIKKELECVGEMMKIISAQLPLPLDSIFDILPYLTEIRAEGSYMPATRLIQLLRMMQMMDNIVQFFRKMRDSESGQTQFPRLDEEFSSTQVFPFLISEIESCVNKYGEVKDNASPELYEIRAQIRASQGSM